MNRMDYNRYLRQLFRAPSTGAVVLAQPMDDSGGHPETFVDYECAFAAEMLRAAAPKQILDVGSYRHFVLGLAAHYNVTSVDIRPRLVTVPGEDCLICDAKNLLARPSSFDAVVSLCSLEHFGLGRYGDQFDLDADAKAFSEMVRVLRPGGVLIFSTTITAGARCLCFNAHRIYDHAAIMSFCSGLDLIDERVHCRGHVGFSKLGRQSSELGQWDVYFGCWRKP